MVIKKPILFTILILKIVQLYKIHPFLLIRSVRQSHIFTIRRLNCFFNKENRNKIKKDQFAPDATTQAPFTLLILTGAAAVGGQDAAGPGPARGARPFHFQKQPFPRSIHRRRFVAFNLSTNSEKT
jgi:hypothetical protein